MSEASASMQASPYLEESTIRPETPPVAMPDKTSFGGMARRTLGLLLLLVTMLLWTASNFLSSTIFADDSFAKPYFVTYLTTASFSVFLLPKLAAHLLERRLPSSARDYNSSGGYASIQNDEAEAFLKPDADDAPLATAESARHHDSNAASLSERSSAQSLSMVPDRLNLRETAKLSLEFCILWFLANFFQSKGLEFTTVASATILMSTSGIWTLLFGSLAKVEVFTAKKLTGVLVSLIGIASISTVDFSGETNKNRGSFPHKSTAEIAVGDVLALGSAILYGVYTVLMKKRIRDESRVDMLLFLGFVGLYNMLLLWPGFFMLHIIGMEPFEFPPTSRIWGIVLLNAFISVVSDICWAYAILLSSPLVVTVGLSLSIPLSLVGQVVLNSQTSTVPYWLGALIVFFAFIFINAQTQEKVPETVGRRVN